MEANLATALISGLLGGTLGSTVTAYASLAVLRRQQDKEASKALWDYHYALTAAAAKTFEATGNIPNHEITLLYGSLDDVIKALREAYPYAGYLSQGARAKLFRNPWIDVGFPWEDDPDSLAISLDKLSLALENELDWIFPRRLFDRLRVIRKRWEIFVQLKVDQKEARRTRKLLNREKNRRQKVEPESTSRKEGTKESTRRHPVGDPVFQEDEQ